MKHQKFKFSFIMPVYNVEKYLTETIESVLKQDIGFLENCELILINDGSPDNSEAICLEYKNRYPDNIHYIKQKNAGPGAARNRGLKIAQGKYISFLDSDDLLSEDTLSSVYNFFEKHYDEIDVVAIKMIFFEARKGKHPLGYRFNADRIIDLKKNHDYVQMSAASAFFKSEILQKHQFEPSVGRYAEDAHLLGKILLERQKYGVLKAPTYYYRKRLDQASSLDSTITDKFWYLETPKKVWKDLFEYTLQQTKNIPLFIQFMVMYDLKWRFKQRKQSVLTDKELAQYKEILKTLLEDINDDIIMEQLNISKEQKVDIIHFKYDDQISKKLTIKNKSIYCNNVKIYDILSGETGVTLESLELQGDNLIIEGSIKGSLPEGVSLKCSVNGSVQETVDLTTQPRRANFFIGSTYRKVKCFKLKIKVRDLKITDVKFYFSNHQSNIGVNIMPARFSYMNYLSKMPYRVLGSKIVTIKQQKLVIKEKTISQHTLSEILYVFSLLKRFKLPFIKQELEKAIKGQSESRKQIVTVPLRSVVRNLYSSFWRIAYYLTKSLLPKNIWLVSDRMYAAGDNGEALFKYINNQVDAPKSVYFTISKKCKDYERLKKYGKVIDRNGILYKLYFLNAEKIISSHADDFVINAFGKAWSDLIDLYKFDFIFLQHGIIKDDLSAWLNKHNKNIKLFVTSSKKEQNAILRENYYYDKSVVKLTGLPRYDYLESDPAGKVILMPTWRQNLAGPTNPSTGKIEKNDTFKESEYYNFYNQLINDKRIINALKNAGLKGELYLHPAFSSQIDDFKFNKYFLPKALPYDYNAAFKKGNLLITDYSSVAFDFAYLKKPVIYTQFDAENISLSHIYDKSYFDYEKDGFGPVVYNYEDAVNQIVNSIKKGTSMTNQYLSRVEDFFYKFDKKNSQRVYEAILKMEA